MFDYGTGKAIQQRPYRDIIEGTSEEESPACGVNTRSNSSSATLFILPAPPQYLDIGEDTNADRMQGSCAVPWQNSFWQ